jgi:hypothetical protein
VEVIFGDPLKEGGKFCKLSMMNQAYVLVDLKLFLFDFGAKIMPVLISTTMQG